MTRLPLLLAILLPLLPAAAGLAAEPTAREVLDTLPKLIQAEAEAKRQGKLPPGSPQTDPNYLLTSFRNIREYLENGDETSVIQQLRQLEQAAATEPVRAACVTVVDKLRQERVDKEAAANSEVDTVLHRAGQAVLAAKDPKDLDASVRDLAALTDRRVSLRRRGDDPNDTRLQAATRFVTRWQDYLLALSRGENRPAGESLRSLIGETDASALLGVPRSEIITRIAPLPSERASESARRTVPAAEIDAAIDGALNRLGTLDDLPVAIRDLTAFRDNTLSTGNSYNANNGDFATTLNALQGLQQTYLELQSGLSHLPPAWFSRNEGQRLQRVEVRLVPLRAQLVALALPRTLGLAETEKPAVGEHVDAFLDRLLAAAKKRGDWEAVARGLEIRRALGAAWSEGGGRSAGESDDTAFRQFFAARNYEQAAEFAQAVAAYLGALGTGSQEIPVALISERLAAIKKDHPADYASGEGAVGVTSSEYGMARRFYRHDLVPAPALEPLAPSLAASPAAPPTPTPAPSPSTPAPSASPKSSP